MASLPNPPAKVRFLDDKGYVSPAWLKWFQESFQRMGGYTAPTNAELENLFDGDLAAINATLETINETLSDIPLPAEALGKGPRL